MDSTLPPDPYIALGVSKTADAATIKSTYRKLVLKSHPDKFPDPALKAQKEEEFHKIQAAYEILGDEEKRSRYEAEVRLDQLRKEALARKASGGSRSSVKVEVPATSYETRTAAPSSATFEARTSRSYSDRKTRGFEEYDRYFDNMKQSSRKETYESYSKRSGRDRQSSKTTKDSDRSRSEKKKERSRAEQQERTAKNTYSYGEDDDSDEYVRERPRYESDSKRRSEEERMRSAAQEHQEHVRRLSEELRRQSQESRRKTEANTRERRNSDERGLRETSSKYQSRLDDARSYIRDTREARPQISRTDSAKNYEYRRSSDRHVEVRRSSARPKDSRHASDRERSRVEIVEPATERRQRSARMSDAQPPNVRLPRAHTFHGENDRNDDSSTQQPAFRRADSMPMPTSTSPRRKDSTYTSSKLRESESATPHDSGYSSPDLQESTRPRSSPTRSPPSSTTRYYNFSHLAGGGVSLAADGYNTTTRSPKVPPEVLTKDRERDRDRDREREREQERDRDEDSDATPRALPRHYSYQTTASSEERRPSVPRVNTSYVRPGNLSRSATTFETRSPERRPSLDDSTYRRSPYFGEVRVQPQIRPEDIRYGSGRRTSRKEKDIGMSPMSPARPSYRREATTVY